MPKPANGYFYGIKVIDATGRQMSYCFNAPTAVAARRTAAGKAKKGGLVLPFKVSIETDRFGNVARRPVIHTVTR